jgi:type IV pilus assembly protein PilF
MLQGHFDVALEKLRKALSYNDSFPEAHNAIALLYEQTGQETLAEHHYQRAVELNAEFTRAKLNYAQFLCTHGNPSEGEKQFLAVATGSPVDSADVYEAYTGAAVCALAIPDRKRADAYLRKALELKPDDASALYRLADLSYGEGEYLKARAFLQRYHALAGYSPESLWLGISIEEKLGDSPLRRQYTQLLLSDFADSDAAQRVRTK